MNQMDSPVSPSVASSTLAGLEGFMHGRDRISADAKELFPGNWEKLCFVRGDQLELHFSGGTATAHTELHDYAALFVDEPYVAGSPADRCVSPTDRLILIRKWPGYRDTLELKLPAEGAQP